MRNTLILILLLVVLCLLFFLDIVLGSSNLGATAVLSALCGTADATTTAIVIDIRLLRTITSIIAGAALAVSGLQMQTLFRNPLAGPFVLGVSSGASLGVALFVMGTGVFVLPESLRQFGIAGAALVGASLVLIAVMCVARRIRDIMVVLILGMMLSSVTGAIVQILQYLSDQQSLKQYVIWTMGSVCNVTSSQMPTLAIGVIAGLILAVLTVKQLNILQLGEEVALTAGVNMRRTRLLLFGSTALLAGSVTAFCGPIGFIGLAMPHVARMLVRTADHRVLLPASLLVGAIAMVACDILAKPWGLPVNVLTALLGVPVVIWIVLKTR